MQNNDFFLEKQRAVERMRDMQRRSENGYPPTPSFAQLRNSTKPTEKVRQKHRQNSSDLLGLTRFLNGEKIDSDVSLILGIFLLLQSENADRLLLYALLYILM